MKDLKHYLSLASILSVGFGLFWYFNYYRSAQIAIIVLMSLAYVGWGIVHHWVKKDLCWQVVLEYLVIAVVASVLVIFLLVRS